jgi:YegS/Rv2252/BmrU family lipid kinase
MRYAFILNPAAQNGRAARHREALEAVLHAEGLAFTLTETAEPGHAVHIAREAARVADAVVAIGGDGTIHEVARGISGTEAVMGVLPLGTGNDFAHAVGMPDDLREAVRALRAAEPKAVDLGRVRWRERGPDGAETEREVLFANCLGIGFDALAALSARRYKVLGSGRTAYLAGVFETLWTWRQPQVEVVVSTDVEAEGAAVPFGIPEGEGERLHAGRFFLIEVGNGFSIGGGFLLTPEAVVDDGLLDVCLIERISRLRVLRLLPTTFRGAHVGEPEVTMRRVHRVTVRSASPLPVHADGEAITAAALALDIAVLPGALRVLAPRLRRP